MSEKSEKSETERLTERLTEILRKLESIPLDTSHSLNTFFEELKPNQEKD